MVHVPHSKKQAIKLARKIKSLERSRVMYELNTNGTSQKSIATMYGLSSTAVNQIISRHKWKLRRMAT